MLFRSGLEVDGALLGAGEVGQWLTEHAPADRLVGLHLPRVWAVVYRIVRNREDVRGLLWLMAWTTLFIALDVWKEGIDRSSRGSIDAARRRDRAAAELEKAHGIRAFAGLVDTGHAGAAAPVERPLETEGVVRVGRDSGRKGLAGGCGHHYRH